MGKFILLCGAVIFSSMHFVSGNCFGQSVISEMLVSLKCEKSPLSLCIESLEKDRHIRVFLPTNHTGKIVTIGLSDVPIGSLFEEIAGQINLKNYTIKFDDETKTVYFASLEGDGTVTHSVIGAMQYPLKGLPAPADLESVKEVSGAEPSVDPNFVNGEVEIFPPSPDGTRGMTLKELRSYELSLKDKAMDPLDMEVLPPVEAGGKGITKRQLDSDIAKAEMSGQKFPHFDALPQASGQNQNTAFVPPNSPFPPSDGR
jgi:hypothetical protein